MTLKLKATAVVDTFRYSAAFGLPYKQAACFRALVLCHSAGLSSLTAGDIGHALGKDGAYARPALMRLARAGLVQRVVIDAPEWVIKPRFAWVPVYPSVRKRLRLKLN